MFRFRQKRGNDVPSEPNSADQSGAVRRHVVFYGRVQGVGFRYQAMGYARELGLTGWVRNDYDGSVEMEVQGTPERIDRLFTQLRSAPYVRIDRVEQEQIAVVCESRFRVTY